MATNKSATGSQLDLIDSLFFCWMAVYFWLGTWGSSLHNFPEGHALVPLVVLLVQRGLVVHGLKRPLHLLSGAVSCLATAGLVSAIPITDSVLQICMPIVFFFWCFHLYRWFLLYALDFTTEAPKDRDLHGLIQVPYYVAATLALLQPFLLFWEHEDRMVLVGAMWVLPFALVYISAWRLEPSTALTYLPDPRLWHRALGRSGVIVSMTLAIALGYGIGLLFTRSPWIWMSFSLILVFQGLTVLRLLYWASASASVTGTPSFN